MTCPHRVGIVASYSYMVIVKAGEIVSVFFLFFFFQKDVKVRKVLQ